MQDGECMPKNRSKSIHTCGCSECLEQPSGEAALLHVSINRLVAALDEKHRRQLAGLLASQFGHGGIQYLSKVTGLDRDTISRGKQEIERAGVAVTGRLRAVGGGRPKVEKKSRAC